MSGIVNIRGKQYATVAHRIGTFRDSFPVADGWGIDTQLVDVNASTVLVRAEIRKPDGTLVAAAHAEEKRGKGINATAALENAETSAVGRALAFAGLGGGEIASADELAVKLQGKVEPGKETKSDTAARRAAHDDDWAGGGQAAFFAAIGRLDVSPTYDDLKAYCLANNRPKPSAMPRAQRDKFVGWLENGGVGTVIDWSHEQAERKAIQEE